MGERNKTSVLTAFALTGSLLSSGCAGFLPQRMDGFKASEELDTLPSLVVDQDGYFMHKGTEMQLKLLAGILEGKIKSYPRNGGTGRIGNVTDQSDAMKYLMQRADTDGDSLITREEGNALYRRMLGTQ